jgi:predicted heme/steroid binding protein
MSVEINVTDQIIEVTPTDAQIDVNITETPVVVDVTDQIIEIAETGLQGPQGPAGPGVPIGGTTGQILAKNSATNYDTLWIDNATGTVTSVNASGISGISVSGGPITASGTLLITNTAPDQIVSLTGAGTTIISGAYPTFTITSNDEYDGTVTSVNASGGVGISVSGVPITSSGTLTITNTAPDQVVSLSGTGTTSISGTYPSFTINSADQYIGTVTSIATTAPITGGTITASGTIGITQSGISTDGYLSSTDWNTFNNKQGTITLTTTGTSGAATLIGNTLNIPQYEAEGNYVTTATTLTINGTTYDLSANRSWSVGTVTSVNASAGTGISVSGVPITGSGTITITNTAPDQVVSLTGTGTTSVTGTYPNFTINSADQYTGTVTSVGLSMPSAFSVSNSPITGAGTINVTGAGTASQYIRGDGQLGDFPTVGGGGGASVSYYLNGSVNQGTIGGSTYYEVSRTPVIGVGTDFSTSTNGLIAQFITDADDPNRLLIPGGNFNLEFYFSASSGGGNPNFYVELYKYDGTNFTLIASNSTSPELIAFGTTISPYFSSLAVPETIIATTDRLAYRIFVNTSGRTITLHTENSHLCQIITTFTTGLSALNGLTAQVQYFSTGTSGTDFNISSVTDTHTFNLPTASATNRGALSTADWGTFNNKENVLSFTSPLSRSINTISIPAATSSINGYLTSADWTTFNNKQNAITLTTSGSSGASTFISNTLNIPNYTLSGLGGVPTTRTLTINGTSYDLSADRSWSVGTVTSVAALTIGTTGTDITSTVANGTTTPVITLNIPTASATNRGALSTADWTTFNAKVGGSGTENYITKWNNAGGTTIGNSLIFDNGTSIGVNTTTPQNSFDIIRGTAGTMPRSNYESASFSYNGDAKLGVYSSATDISNNGASVIFGNSQTTVGSLYTGGEVQYLGNTTIANSSLRFSFVGRNSSGVVTSAVENALRIYHDGRIVMSPTLSGAYVGASTPRLIIGTTTDTSETLQITGTAKITGNLTVDTNTLFVDATNNRVGIGTASPATPLHIEGNSTGGDVQLRVKNNNLANGNKYVSLFVGGTSTGITEWNNSGVLESAAGTGSNLVLSNYEAGNIIFQTNNRSEKMRITSGGNLGLGVSPSAWSTFKVLQVGSLSSLYSSPSTYLGHNIYYNSGNKYIANGYAQLYGLNDSGQYVWYQAPSGTAGAAISFTQAMTLNASGRLLLGTTTDNGTDRLQVSGSGIVTKFKVDDATNGRITLENFAANNAIYSTTSGFTAYKALNIYTSSDTATLSLASTGAATFSSSVTSTQFRLSALNTAPASSTATGTTGEIRIDAFYIYICIATNSWKRVATASW